MRLSRFWIGDALICLPLVTLVAGGWFVFRSVLPALEAREAKRVQTVYRDAASAIRAGEAEDVFVCQPISRRSQGRLGRGTWGLEPRGDEALVWYRPPKSADIYGVLVPTVEVVPVRRWFWSVGLGLLAVLTVLADLGLRFFRRRAREREDFLAAVAHDLMTPLVGLRRMIGRDDAESKRLNERLIRLVENVRDYLQMGGRRRVERTTFPVGRAFEEAYQLFRADFEDSASGPLIVTGDPQVSVVADETMLVQVFWNLLGNELKYAAHQGEIRVDFSRASGKLLFRLADRGPGMTAYQLRHAFDRYFRAKSALQSGKGGFGIGLCMAREFVRACDGDLTVRANQPSGCVFTLRLPLA